MLVNRDSRRWIVASLLVMAAAAVFYAMELSATAARGGPSGGTWYGLILGAAGSAMMLFALLLALKKRFRTLRVGRAYFWMKGHVWIGLLSYPVILLHAGFRFGGPFTQVLMWLFTLVILTGIVGLFIQQIIPGKLLHEVSFETVFEEIDHVIAQLAAEAEEIVQRAVAVNTGEAFEMEVVPAGGAVATLPERTASAARTFNDFYTTHVRPYLLPVISPGATLKTEPAARVAFEYVRTTLPVSLQEPLNDLASIVEERRQLARQKQLHHWLHGWLLVHVPASYALVLLAAWHAIFALRFIHPHW
jgi:hypothetical protein